MLTSEITQRVSDVRTWLEEQGLDGFIIPRADEFQGEYVPTSAERLAWITGFTGSAGTAVVLKERAALVVDGRYTIQAEQQMAGTPFEVVPLKDKTPQAWTQDAASKGQKIGYDPRLHTPDAIGKWTKSLEKAGATLEAKQTPVDRLWRERPDAPSGAAVVHGLAYAGQATSEKVADVQSWLKDEDCAAALISDPHSVNWLFNIRGSDLPYTPIVLARALVRAEGAPVLILEPDRVPDEVAAHLGDVLVLPDDDLPRVLAELSGAVAVDQSSVTQALVDAIKAAGLEAKPGQDPCALPKAQKNDTELNGIIAAHVRDGAALTKFLAWMDTEAPKGQLTELTAAEKLEEFRRQSNSLHGLSFPTISGAAENGAVVHYSVTEQSARSIGTDMLYLVDSGGQYPDGTTDVTRTIVVGTPTEEQRDRFTRVLKGHIALARAVFPDGTTGSQLDALARAPLWEAGLDFDHGTGHGVGAFLSVHEGPQFIASRASGVALKPGMIISNEPGYYKAGEFGIRIENLVTVVRAHAENGERDIYKFDTLTLAPIDLRLVTVELLTADERAWLNAYHARVRDTLSPLVDEPTRAWLTEATRPLGQ